jgi:hypothetical protein
MVNILYDWHRRFYPNVVYHVDGANVDFVRQMKIALNEEPNYNLKIVSVDTDECIPVSFGSQHKEMLSHLYTFANKGYIAIPEKFEKLLISLRTARAKEYALLKKETSYSDILDPEL